jgi:hypothetical protein
LITLSIPRDGIFFFIKTQLLPVLWVPWWMPWSFWKWE